MISPTCNFKQFLDAIQARPVIDMIDLANHEASEAWRKSHRAQKTNRADGRLSAEYHRKLVCLIDFMRYRVKTKSLPADDLEAIDSICQRVDNRKSPADSATSIR